MITYKHVGGYGKEGDVLMKITTWRPEMERDMAMRFYNGNPENLAGIERLSTGTIEIARYANMPFDKNLSERMSNNEDVLNSLLDTLPDEKPKAVLDVELLKLVSVDDFTRWAPNYADKHYIFIFYQEELKELPVVHFCEKPYEVGPFKHMFQVQVLASQSMYKPVKATDFGKKLVYNLIEAYITGEFRIGNSNYIGVPFPTKGENSVPEYLNAERFLELCEKADVSKVLVTPAGFSYAGDTTKPTEPDYDDDASAGDEFSEMVGSFLANRDTVLMEDIRDSYIDRNTVSLLKMVSYGIQRTITMLPSKVPVDIEIDIQETFIRKACIFDGFLHVVPKSMETLPDDFDILDEEFEFVMLDTDESYPKRNSSSIE